MKNKRKGRLIKPVVYLMQNTVIETMLQRSSIRGYEPIPLTEEQLEALKKAALSSPTAMNRQDQRFIFVTDPERQARLEQAIIEGVLASGNKEFAERMKARGGKVTYDAPLVVIICAKPSHFAPVDAGIAVENLVLAAQSMGLGSVILGMPASAFGPGCEEAKREFGFPEGFEFMIAVSIGTPAVHKDPHEWDESHIIMM